MKTYSGKKGEGMPVVRNPQFYFKEGFCWSDINTTYLKCRKKQNSISDVKSMSLFGVTDKVPERYIICLINSTFMSLYVDNFVNNTQTFQINDARQLPIIIPDDTILKQLSGTFIKAQCIKQNEFAGLIDDTIANKDLQVIQKDVDGIVNALYGI